MIGARNVRQAATFYNQVLADHGFYTCSMALFIRARILLVAAG
jgi:hypothetical protein